MTHWGNQTANNLRLALQKQWVNYYKSTNAQIMKKDSVPIGNSNSLQSVVSSLARSIDDMEKVLSSVIQGETKEERKDRIRSTIARKYAKIVEAYDAAKSNGIIQSNGRILNDLLSNKVELLAHLAKNTLIEDTNTRNARALLDDPDLTNDEKTLVLETMNERAREVPQRHLMIGDNGKSVVVDSISFREKNTTRNEKTDIGVLDDVKHPKTSRKSDDVKRNLLNDLVRSVKAVNNSIYVEDLEIRAINIGDRLEKTEHESGRTMIRRNLLADYAELIKELRELRHDPKLKKKAQPYAEYEYEYEGDDNYDATDNSVDVNDVFDNDDEQQSDMGSTPPKRVIQGKATKRNYPTRDKYLEPAKAAESTSTTNKKPKGRKGKGKIPVGIYVS